MDYTDHQRIAQIEDEIRTLAARIEILAKKQGVDWQKEAQKAQQQKQEQQSEPEGEIIDTQDQDEEDEAE